MPWKSRPMVGLGFGPVDLVLNHHGSAVSRRREGADVCAPADRSPTTLSKTWALAIPSTTLITRVPPISNHSRQQSHALFWRYRITTQTLSVSSSASAMVYGPHPSRYPEADVGPHFLTASLPYKYVSGSERIAVLLSDAITDELRWRLHRNSSGSVSPWRSQRYLSSDQAS